MCLLNNVRTRDIMDLGRLQYFESLSERNTAFLEKYATWDDNGGGRWVEGKWVEEDLVKWIRRNKKGKIIWNEKYYVEYPTWQQRIAKKHPWIEDILPCKLKLIYVLLMAMTK